MCYLTSVLSRSACSSASSKHMCLVITAAMVSNRSVQAALISLFHLEEPMGDNTASNADRVTRWGGESRIGLD